MNLLVKGRSLQSTDKRDRVFALVGLCSDFDASLIDYAKSFEERLVRLATKHIHGLLASSDPSLVYVYLCMVHKNESLEGRASWARSYEFPTSFRSLDSIFRSNKLLKTKSPFVLLDSKVKSIAILYWLLSVLLI